MTLQDLKKVIESKYLHYGDFTLSSGQKSNKYFDIKSMIGNFDQYVLEDALTDKLHRDIDHNTYSCLGGLELGGALIVAALKPSNLHSKCFIRKGDTKRVHGLKKMIEGNPISPILLVDDVVSTTKTLRDAITTLAISKGGPYYIAGFLCVINRSNVVEIGGMPVFSLFTEEDFKVEVKNNG